MYYLCTKIKHLTDMKKYILSIAALFIAAFALTTEVNAQNNAKFNKGDLAFNLDYGMGSFNSFDGHKFDDNIFQHSIGLSGEYGIIDGMINGKASIGVGAQIGLGFGRDKYEYKDNGIEMVDKTIATRIRIATRGVFHYQFTPAFDTYGGLTFCFVDIDNFTWKYSVGGVETKADDTDVNFIEPRLFVGARYMVSSAFGFNLETTWDRFAYVALGVTFKF